MSRKRILLVEGKDDLHVISNICEVKKVPSIDKVIQLDSVEKLLEDIPVRLKAGEDGDIVGIVIDADTDLEARWISIRDRLVKVGYQQLPENPSPDGTIITPPPDSLLPRVGIWIMPDNQTKGILEDFLRFLVPAGSPLFAHVEASIAAIPTSELQLSELSKPKALIHTWLAWQEEPGKPMGQAITARYLDADVPQVEVFVSWLNRLYFP